MRFTALPLSSPHSIFALEDASPIIRRAFSVFKEKRRKHKIKRKDVENKTMVHQAPKSTSQAKILRIVIGVLE